MIAWCAPERIDAALKAIQSGPLSVYGVMEKTGFGHASMTAAIMRLANAGKIEVAFKIKTGGRPVNVYQIAREIPPAKSVAGRITIPQFRWGATRLG